MAEERHRFLRSVDEKAVVRLASSYHNGESCKIFGSNHGSFNACFFVAFDPASKGDRTDRWVVRVPIATRVHWVAEKLEVEVATMKSVFLLPSDIDCR